MSTPVTVVRTPDDMTPWWLGDVLGRDVAHLDVTRIGTGQMSESYRVTLDGGPDTVVVKVAASDPTSRATGVGLGAYEREVRFYAELAERIGGPLPACHLAVLDPAEGWFTLVLEDVSPAHQGDQIAGCAVEEARLALAALARLHAPVFNDQQLGVTPWLNVANPLNQALLTQLVPGFEERFGDRVSPEHLELVKTLVARLDGWASDRRPPLGLVHGDFRLDNLLFGDDGSVTAVDWQTVSWGPVMADAAYFLGGGLSVADRRAHEEELLRGYHAALGAAGFSWEQCWEDYRRQTFGGVLMAVAASMLVERTERGDDMFMTTLARHAQQAIDLDSVALLPAPGTGRPAPLVPEAADEARHPAGGEELWNESWYFDWADAATGVGGYVRLGLYPNLGVAWYTAFVVGEGRPTVAVVDLQAPLPEGEDLVTDTDDVDAALRCDAPLRTFTLTLRATGAAHDDPAALLRDAPGRPAAVTLDLSFATEGEPYQYRLATRYEIPCRVTGTITVDGETIAVDAVGQRDHSWGTRDWWSMDWVWSAAHLDDGTRLHAVELRIPDTPRIGVGYVQAPGEELQELDAVVAREQAGDDGLIVNAQLDLQPAGITLDVTPVAFGPLRLEAPDGRVSHFPRAMCRVATGDGRSGLAWVEWNRNRAGAGG